MSKKNEKKLHKKIKQMEGDMKVMRQWIFDAEKKLMSTKPRAVIAQVKTEDADYELTMSPTVDGKEKSNGEDVAPKLIKGMGGQVTVVCEEKKQTPKVNDDLLDGRNITATPFHENRFKYLYDTEPKEKMTKEEEGRFIGSTFAFQTIRGTFLEAVKSKGALPWEDKSIPNEHGVFEFGPFIAVTSQGLRDLYGLENLGNHDGALRRVIDALQDARKDTDGFYMAIPLSDASRCFKRNRNNQRLNIFQFKIS